jgi:hypothetical protein
MYPRIPLGLVADPVGSAKQTLGTTGLGVHSGSIFLPCQTKKEWREYRVSIEKPFSS